MKSPLNSSSGGGSPSCSPTGDLQGQGHKLRRIAAQNLQNASIDKLDSCNEITAGFIATIVIMLLLWIVMIPAFDIGAMGWLRWWEGLGMCLPEFSQAWNESSFINTTCPFEAGAMFDRDDDHVITWDEFYDVVQHFPSMNVEQAKKAYNGLDVDSDGVLTTLDIEEALRSAAQPRDAQAGEHDEDVHEGCWPRVHRQGTTTSTARPTTRSNDVVTLAPVAPVAPTFLSSSSTSTPHERSKDFANVGMQIKSLNVGSLNGDQKLGIANAFRADLAYAAGILSSQVMDAEGKTGCVSMSPIVGNDYAVLLQGCLPIPAGATEADIQAVVTSGTETYKIVKDIAVADGGLEVGVKDISIDVTSLASCGDATPPSFSHSLCGGDIPEPPLTASTTSSQNLPVHTDFGDFWQRLGQLDTSCLSSAKFAVVDTNGDEFSDINEFIQAAKGLDPPYTQAESERLFGLLDRNADERVETLEFYEACKQAFPDGQPSPDGGGSKVTLAQYRRSLGRKAEYHKVGVGLCRTKDEAWPQSSEHPDVVTKEDCQRLCENSDLCGAFASKPGGTCRIYPSNGEYPDTTPMVDVECFAKVFNTEAPFDIAQIRFKFDAALDFTEAQRLTVGERLAKTVAFEVAADLKSVTDLSGHGQTCSVFQGSASAFEAVCVVALDTGHRIEDITAVVKTDTTLEYIASDLSNMLSPEHLGGGQIHAWVEGSSPLFRIADMNNGGAVDLAEFVKTTKAMDPPLNEEAAIYAFAGLDLNKDDKLSAAEFEAHNMQDFFQEAAR